MTLAYIKQRTAWDCGIAALAMACRLPYDRVAADLLPDATEEKGVNDTLVKDWLCRNDWAWQEVTRNLWKRNSFHPVHPWPPSPFANTHICFVEATCGWHYCALDFDGRVYDPHSEDRHSLDHPDYKRVSSVIGLFKIRVRRDQVSSPVGE